MVTVKTCFKCGKEKPIEMFYRHPAMRDGHLGKCIECAKKDVTARAESEEGRRKIAEYERDRYKRPDRRSKALEYQTRSRKSHPKKARARRLVNNRLRYGKLKREPCQRCGAEKSQAHHTDYRFPMKITWLCFKCHRTAHGQTVNS
jgi:ribosomal protein S27AE